MDNDLKAYIIVIGITVIIMGAKYLMFSNDEKEEKNEKEK